MSVARKNPLARFLHWEPAGGLVLLACAVIALGLANSPLANAFETFWHLHLGFNRLGLDLDKPLEFWVNDGLMVVFFYTIGLEIKREWLEGELSEPRNTLLPGLAALGGMVVPALLYLTLHGFRGPGAAGWSIPMATDIAFVVGTLALLGARVPRGLKVFLLTLAVVDDLGAIFVIAVVFTAAVSFVALFLAGLGLLTIAALQFLRVRPAPVYILVGVLVWLAFLQSGVHPTIVGVLLGVMTTHRPGPDGKSPLVRWQERLHPWVSFAIMPIFALCNAGVAIEPAAFLDATALAVMVGLVVGKPLGIALFSFLAVVLRIGRLPAGVNAKVLLSGGCLAGIGFTMSLFLADLSFVDPVLRQPPQQLAPAKLGVLVGSTISMLLGGLLLFGFLGKPAKQG